LFLVVVYEDRSRGSNEMRIRSITAGRHCACLQGETHSRINFDHIKS
jgi:hypothetical protein